MTTSPAIVLDLIEAFRRSKTMFVAAELSLFERLPQTETEIRLAEACVALGLMNPDFSPTAEAKKYLRHDSPDTLLGYIEYSNRVLYHLWADLEGAVREGTNRWGSSGDLFANFYASDESMRSFLMGMNGFGRLSSPAVVAAFDLARFRKLVDLGGATGHLAMAARERYPAMSATIFDLPRVIGFARTIATGIDFLEGDFFADPLPSADLYSLGRILHDWAENKIRTLLRKIYEALPAGGGLLIAELLLDEDHRGPIRAHMQSLNMLVCTEGRERSLSEYRDLLRAAGFASIEGVKTGKPVDAVLAIKDGNRS
jgi:acetylserotonin N-methyltransferase